MLKFVSCRKKRRYQHNELHNVSKVDASLRAVSIGRFVAKLCSCEISEHLYSEQVMSSSTPAASSSAAASIVASSVAPPRTKVTITPGNAKVSFMAIGQYELQVQVMTPNNVMIIYVLIGGFGNAQTAYSLYDQTTGNGTQGFTYITNMPVASAPGNAYYFTISGNTMTLYTSTGTVTGTITHPALSTANSVVFTSTNTPTYAGSVVATQLVSTSSSAVTSSVAVPKNKTKKIVISVLVVAILVAAGGALFVHLHKKHKAHKLAKAAKPF